MAGERVEKRDAGLPPARGVAIAELAGRQHGVVSRDQLRGLGLDRNAVRRRVKAGSLHPLGEGAVYAIGKNPLSRKGRYLAAVLACGPGTWVSHRSAGQHWGLRASSGAIEVTVPRGRDGVSESDGIVVHRTRMLDPQDFTVVDGIPATSVPRTLLDLAGVLRPRDLEVAVDRAERLGLFDLDAVVELLRRARGRKGARALRGVLAAYELSTQKSELEKEFKRLLATAPDIPDPFFNALVDGEAGTHEVDAHWQRARLAVQVDGFEFHRTRRDREKDAESDADLELAGTRVMRLTWDDVTGNGQRTLRRVRLALGLA